MSTQWSSPGNSFPWDNTIAGLIEPKDDVEVLRTSIEVILLTRVGERVMLRDFGSKLYEKVFDQNDSFLRNEIITEIREAIRKWDDRIGIESMNVIQQDHYFEVQIVFYNAKDPLKTPRTFVVNFRDVGLGQ